MTKLAEQFRQGADQALESLVEGWRELSARASGALTRFLPAPASARASPSNTTAPQDEAALPFGGWAFMASDVFDDSDKVIVRSKHRACGVKTSISNYKEISLRCGVRSDLIANSAVAATAWCNVLMVASAAMSHCRCGSKPKTPRLATATACYVSNSPRLKKPALFELPSRQLDHSRCGWSPGRYRATSAGPAGVFTVDIRE